MVHQVQGEEPNDIQLEKINDEIHLHIEGYSINKLKTDDPSKFLMETMARQLKGDLTVQPSQNRMVWKLAFKIR